jgi:hypothetical protein
VTVSCPVGRTPAQNEDVFCDEYGTLRVVDDAVTADW